MVPSSTNSGANVSDFGRRAVIAVLGIAALETCTAQSGVCTMQEPHHVKLHCAPHNSAAL